MSEDEGVKPQPKDLEDIPEKKIKPVVYETTDKTAGEKKEVEFPVDPAIVQEALEKLAKTGEPPQANEASVISMQAPNEDEDEEAPKSEQSVSNDEAEKPVATPKVTPAPRDREASESIEDQEAVSPEEDASQKTNQEEQEGVEEEPVQEKAEQEEQNNGDNIDTEENDGNAESSGGKEDQPLAEEEIPDENKELPNYASQDFYTRLGVRSDATPDEIKKAYRRLARELHPDVNPDPDTQARYKAVTEAYDTLSNEGKRKTYDQLQIEASKQKFDLSGVDIEALIDFVYARMSDMPLSAVNLADLYNRLAKDRERQKEEKRPEPDREKENPPADEPESKDTEEETENTEEATDEEKPEERGQTDGDEHTDIEDSSKTDQPEEKAEDAEGKSEEGESESSDDEGKNDTKDESEETDEEKEQKKRMDAKYEQAFPSEEIRKVLNQAGIEEYLKKYLMMLPYINNLDSVAIPEEARQQLRQEFQETAQRIHDVANADANVRSILEAATNEETTLLADIEKAVYSAEADKQAEEDEPERDTKAEVDESYKRLFTEKEQQLLEATHLTDEVKKLLQLNIEAKEMTEEEKLAVLKNHSEAIKTLYEKAQSNEVVKKLLQDKKVYSDLENIYKTMEEAKKDGQKASEKEGREASKQIKNIKKAVRAKVKDIRRLQKELEENPDNAEKQAELTKAGEELNNLRGQLDGIRQNVPLFRRLAENPVLYYGFMTLFIAVVMYCGVLTALPKGGR